MQKRSHIPDGTSAESSSAERTEAEADKARESAADMQISRSLQAGREKCKFEHLDADILLGCTRPYKLCWSYHTGAVYTTLYIK